MLYHKDLDAFLLVRQFRPAVYSCRLREAKEAGQPAPDRAAGEGGGQSGQQAALAGGGTGKPTGGVASRREALLLLLPAAAAYLTAAACRSGGAPRVWQKNKSCIICW